MIGVGVVIGYLGFRVFKLTISVWAALFCGLIGAFIVPFVAYNYTGLFRYSGSPGYVFLITIGVFLFVWPLKFLNRPKQSVLHATRMNVPSTQSSKYSINNIQEADTSYEPNGYEERAIDNSKNDGYIKRRLTISREWTRTISIEKSTTTSLSASIGLQGFANLSLEKALQDKYHVEVNERKTFTEEIELEVLPRSKTVLRIEWKTIWQNGIIELTDQDQNLIFIPYKVSKGLTFDQVQEKVN